MKKLEAERNPAAPDEDDPWEIDAIEFMLALIDAATMPGGVSPADYKAPLGEGIQRKVTPWLGEFRTSGVAGKGEGRRHYRMYFAEPDIDAVVLSALLAHKSDLEMGTSAGHGGRPAAHGKQTKQISAAMDITARWCKANEVKFRTI